MIRSDLLRALAVPALLLAPATAVAQRSSASAVETVRVVSDESGRRLQVDGRDFMVYGMNWGYMPIGENYTYDFWGKPDDFIEAALAREMPLLQDMGINSIRQYVGIPARWITYIHEQYGIYTVLNPLIGRYGYTLDGVWNPVVDYSDPRMREAIKAETLALVEEYKDTPGLLMWLLGNENNYGLSWSSFEIEALPKGEQEAARARFLYSLMGEITVAIQEIDSRRPVSMANGDVQYIDIIAQEVPTLDVFGTNVYRGISARDLFQVVEEKMGIPVVFTEFGSDAFNSKENREDQAMQAYYLLGQWQEIYEQSAGKGRVGNAIGGMIFQWSDGWWKFGQDSRLDIHDTHASWPNGGYYDFVEGDFNMNEEWWGICAKGPRNAAGFYEVYPRAAYFALRDAFALDPYAPTTDLAAIRAHFAPIRPMAAELEARGDRAAMIADALQVFSVTGVRLDLRTYSTGGSNISTPPAESPQNSLPAFRGFDHMQSVYGGFRVRPSDNVSADFQFNLLGNVPTNPIDEVFYENRGRRQTVDLDGEPVDLQALERVKLYRATVDWDDRYFRLQGFYRTGHLHWGYEGDFFGLYRDAYYGENIDIYNGEAPVGVEMEGKKSLEGFKLAFGPQLWWGANPSIFLKYRRNVGPFDATAIYQNEFAAQNTINSSVAVPLPPTEKLSLQASTSYGPLGIEGGVLYSGGTKKGEEFQIAERNPDGTYTVYQDAIENKDAWGGKLKLTYQKGRFNWYGQAAYFGAVADGGPIYPITFTGWRLKDSGWGNQSNILTGISYRFGNLEVAPNFLWQKPLFDPIPGDVSAPGRPRNVLDDPFAVRGNRETTAFELLLSHDPTPATWMWAWDNVFREDAALAWSVGFEYRDLPTTMDASIGILEDGRTTFAFPGATPPRELWEVRVRTVSRLAGELRLNTNWFAGTGEPNGDDPRLIHRYGMDARFTWRGGAFAMHAKFNDWGPYDYHRDFNLTYPVQLMGDISKTLGLPQWYGLPETKFGIRTTWRTLDQYSSRYCPSSEIDAGGNTVCITDDGQPLGREWEIRTYLQIAI